MSAGLMQLQHAYKKTAFFHRPIEADSLAVGYVFRPNGCYIAVADDVVVAVGVRPERLLARGSPPRERIHGTYRMHRCWSSFTWLLSSFFFAADGSRSASPSYTFFGSSLWVLSAGEVCGFSWCREATVLL